MKKQLISAINQANGVSVRPKIESTADSNKLEVKQKIEGSLTNVKSEVKSDSTIKPPIPTTFLHRFQNFTTMAYNNNQLETNFKVPQNNSIV